MRNMVSEWYETKKNVDEMMRWENPQLKKWEQRVAGFFPSNARILDVGCGLGREAFVLSDMGFVITGVDISHEVIKNVNALSAQKGYNILFVQYDGYTLPFQANSFDVVIIWAQTFGLIYGNEYECTFLSECRRVLCENGLLSFSGHDFRFLTQNYKNCVRDRRFFPYTEAGIYWETFELGELESYAEHAGYTVVLCEEGEVYKPEDGTILHCLCRK